MNDQKSAAMYGCGPCITCEYRRTDGKIRTSCLACKWAPRNDPRIYWAKEVTFDYETNPVRVDYMRFKPLNNTISGIEKGDVYCYEVKSSVEDFRSKNGHNFLGDFNYYVMPEDVFVEVKREIPFSVGVYCPGGAPLKLCKRARRMHRNRAVGEMLLMMWRSSRREVVKIKRAKREDEQ